MTRLCVARHTVAAFAVGTIALASADAQGALRTVDHRGTPTPTARWAAGVGNAPCTATLGAESPRFPDGLYRVTSGTRLPNGTLVTVSAATLELTFLDSLGRVVGVGGGRGGGPGEFNSQSAWLAPYRGDSVIAYGIFATGVAVYGPTGHFARTIPLQRTDGVVNPGSILGHAWGDGSVVTRQYVRIPTPETGTAMGRDSVVLRWFGADGRQRGETPRIPDAMVARSRPVVTPRPPDPGSGARGFTTRYTLTAAGPVTRADGIGAWTAAANGGHLWHFEEANDALVAYAADGRQALRVLVRPLEHGLRPGAGGPLHSSQRLELRSDRLGRAWLEVAREALDAPGRWWVFDGDGRWVAEARTPSRAANLMEIGSDYVLLLESDADGMQTVRYCPVRPAT